MKKIINGNKTIITRVWLVVVILALIAAAAWELKLSIALAAKAEEDKVVSDEQAQPEPLAAPEMATIQFDAEEAEGLLASIRIFSTTAINNVPTQNELNETQAAALAVKEIQRVFGADLSNTIMEIAYRNRALWVFRGDLEVPEPVRERFLDDFKEWLDPPTWSVDISMVDKNKYKDCRTYSEFTDKTDHEFKASGQNYQVWPTDYQCEFNALTGEISWIFRSSPSDDPNPYGVWEYIDEREGEQLYRDFLRTILPNLTISSIELVDTGGYTEIDGVKTAVQQTKITMSDGSGFLFENAHLWLVKYFPKGVPDKAIGH